MATHRMQARRRRALRWGVLLSFATVAACAAGSGRDAQAPADPAAIVLSVAPAPASVGQPESVPAEPAAPRVNVREKLLDPTLNTLHAPMQFRVSFHTTAGDFVVRVHRDWAPQAADRFYNLVWIGFYDGAAFFRVVPDFIVQFGLPGAPDVSAAWKNAKIPDDPVVQSNLRGTITFAMAGPNSRTTQLFINLRDNARLDGMNFTPFGTVEQGMGAVDAICSEYGEQPSQPRIQSEGNAWLMRAYPRLDTITRAVVLP